MKSGLFRSFHRPRMYFGLPYSTSSIIKQAPTNTKVRHMKL